MAVNLMLSERKGKIMKKISLLLAVCMTLGMTACGGAKKEAQDSGDRPLTYWTAINSSQITTMDNYSMLPMFQKLMEKTGVKLEFLHPPAGQAAEQYNLLIASGDYPDIIERNWAGDLGGPGKAIRDGIIIPLEETIEKYAPNYNKLLSENKELKKAFSTDDGHIFTFGSITLTPDLMPGGYLIRKDWLAKLGMEAPKCIEDWEKYFEACKTQLGVEAPFSTDNYRMNTAMLFSESFGIGSKFYVDSDNTVKYAPIQPEFKEYLTLMNKWFELGYLDKGIFTNEASIVESKVLNSMTGATYGFIGSTLGKLIAAAPDSNFKLEAVASPALKAGEEPKLYVPKTVMEDGQKLGYSLTSTVAFTVKNKDLEKSAKLMDYLYTDEGKLLKNFGIEGTSYNMKDGKPVYTDEILNNPDGLSVSEALGKYCRAGYPCPGFGDDPDYLSQYYKYPEQIEAMKVYSTNLEHAVAFDMPALTPAAEEVTEISTLLSTINTYQEEMFAKFIMGTEPLENFDKYAETIKSMKIDRILEIYNSAMKRYMSR